MRDTREQRRRLPVLLSLVVIIAFICLSGTLRLHAGADRQTDAVQSLEVIMRSAEQMDRNEDALLSAQVGAGMVVESDLIRAELDTLPDSDDASGIGSSLDAYVAALDETAALLAANDRTSAEQVLREQVEPAGLALRTAVDSALEDAVHARETARRRALVGTVGTVVLTFAAVTALLVAYDRNRWRSVELVRQERARFRALVEHGSDITAIVDPDGTIRFITPAVRSVFDQEPDALAGKNLADVALPDEWAAIYELLQEAVAAQGRPVRHELRLTGPGERVVTLDTMAASRLDDPAVHGIVVSARDVSDRKALLETLRHQAYHDSLTSLPNRLLLADRLEQAFHRAARTHRPVAVLFLDLDGFKVVNDRLGHAGGDKLLIEAARKMQEVIRSEDTLARMGGDEFVLVLEKCDEALAVTIANRLLEQLSSLTMGDETFDIGASIGIAVRDDSSISTDDLLGRADIAMYRAKANPASSIAVYRPLEGALDALRLTGD